ncbi:S-methyl-5-thioribose-1-phosphate isomerase [bacterium]
MNHIIWKNNKLICLDQTKLPLKKEFFQCKNYSDACKSIKDMIVRGAPLIGITAAYGIAQAVYQKPTLTKIYFAKVCNDFTKTRPTAVNLFWAIDRMKKVFYKNYNKKNLSQILISEAKRIHKDDIEINKKIGLNGQKLIKKKINILTHCNAGALATAGYGTALGVIRALHEKGRVNMVYVDETRPYLQGARLTAWELMEDKIPCKLNCDNMAGYLMSKGLIDLVVVGADRVAANGDAANKIGSYSLSILAKYHRIPFWVAAPVSTFDMKTKNGNDIIIEERPIEEVTHCNGKLITLKKMKAVNPSFDVVPFKNISAIITEMGVITKLQDIKNITQRK